MHAQPAGTVGFVFTIYYVCDAKWPIGGQKLNRIYTKCGLCLRRRLVETGEIVVVVGRKAGLCWFKVEINPPVSGLFSFYCNVMLLTTAASKAASR